LPPVLSVDNPGVVHIESWFFIDRSSYANQPVAASVTQPVNWEESFSAAESTKSVY
jgi:hypothetical protein